MSSENRFVLGMLMPAALFLGLLVAYPICLLIYNSLFAVKTIAPDVRNGSALPITSMP